MRDTSDCTNCNGSEERSRLRAELAKARAERDALRVALKVITPKAAKAEAERDEAERSLADEKAGR